MTRDKHTKEKKSKASSWAKNGSSDESTILPPKPLEPQAYSSPRQTVRVDTRKECDVRNGEEYANKIHSTKNMPKIPNVMKYHCGAGAGVGEEAQGAGRQTPQKKPRKRQRKWHRGGHATQRGRKKERKRRRNLSSRKGIYSS